MIEVGITLAIIAAIIWTLENILDK